MKKSVYAGLFLLIAFHSVTSGRSAVRAQVSGTAPAEDLDIYYQTYGEGLPLLVINGGPGFASTHFQPLAQKLSTLGDGYQTIIFDQRGTGQSTLSRVDSTTVNLEAMVADVEALREHLGLAQWTVMGHSFGGMLAMAYAAAYPKRVRALILSASGGIDLEPLQYFSANVQALLTPQEQDSLAYWSDPDRTAADPGRAYRGRVRAMMPAYLFNREHVPEVVKALTQGTYEPQVNALVWADLFRIDYNLRGPLRRCDKPVLIVQGRQDPVGVGTAYESYLVFPNSELVLINRCGHYLWLDRPERYFDVLATFLGKVSRSS